MSDQRQQRLETQLLQLLPADFSSVGNITLLAQWQAAVPDATEDDFKTARDALVAAGLAVKGKGRGGSTARATGAARPDFALNMQTAPAPSVQPTQATP